MTALFNEDDGKSPVLLARVVDVAGKEHPITFWHYDKWHIPFWTKWMSKMDGTTKKPRDVDQKDHPNYIFMPGVARFGKKLYPTNSRGVFSINDACHLLETGDGDMWVRCASGCCNAFVDLSQ